MTMTQINVTQDHIDQGWQRRCHRCPVALAIKDAVPGSNPRIFATTYYLTDDSRSLPLPAEVTAFIVAYDDRRPVAPFTFELDVS